MNTEVATVIDVKAVERLMACFPNSFINGNLEFIAHRKANEYFGLKNCMSEMDIKCKVLEWFSRGCYKTEPYITKASNEKFHKFMLNGVNEYLGTNFTEDDMETIYTYLGNCCDHQKTIRFIESGYNMNIL